jgi:SAM-dependent methyltransferase
LDLGCGSGELTVEIGKVVGGNDLYGIEIAEDYARLSQSKGIKCCRADLNKPFPIKDESFDVVIANQVIEHIYQTDLFVREIYRVLKFGGVTIISTPNLAEPTNIISLIMGFHPPTIFASDEFYFLGFPFHKNYKMRRDLVHPGHLRAFVPRSLKDLFEAHGFKVEKIIGVGHYFLPLLISNCLSKITPTYSISLLIREFVGGHRVDFSPRLILFYAGRASGPLLMRGIGRQASQGSPMGRRRPMSLLQV